MKYYSKRTKLKKDDIITSITTNVKYIGLHGEYHVYSVEELIDNRKFNLAHHMEHEPCVEIFEKVLKKELFGVKLTRGMQMIDLINHDRMLKQESE